MTKKLLLILIPSVLLLGSCQSDQPSIIEVDQPSIIEVDQQDLILTLNDESEKVFTFKTTDSWTVSVTDTSSVKWLSLSQMNGAKGENSIEIKTAPNHTFADRKALITIKSGSSEFTVSVFQEFGNGVTDIDIPDKAFAKYCLDRFDTDENGLISYNEVKDVKTLSFFYEYYREIKSLVGIEYFTNLERLNCTQQNLMELDLSRNTKLQWLECSNNMLTNIDLSNNTELIFLSTYYNKNLEKLDLSNNTKLTELYCSDGPLTELEVKNLPELQILDCAYNSLSTLDLSMNPKLTEVYCQNNQLSAIDLSVNTNLVSLFCGNNLFSVLDLTANKAIKSVICTDSPNLREVWIAKDNTPYINKDSHTTVIYK